MRAWFHLLLGVGAVALFAVACSATADLPQALEQSSETVVEPSEETDEPVEAGEVEIGSSRSWTEITTAHDRDLSSLGQRVSPDGRWLGLSGAEVCIVAVHDPLDETCAAEETFGTDGLSWSPDSSGVTPGGSVSGRWNASGVWIVGTNGSTTSVSPVEAGRLIPSNEISIFDSAMAFRPDGESIVFVQSDLQTDRIELLEVDLDRQSETRLARLDSNIWSTRLPVVPLGDSGVVLTDGDIDTPEVVLFEGGNRTVIARGIEQDLAGAAPKPPIVVQATEVLGGLALVTYPGLNSTRGLPTDPTRWSLFNLEGQEFLLNDGPAQQIVGATLSPDGTHVAYLRVDLPDADTFGSGDRIPGELLLTTVDAVLAGEPPFASRVLDGDFRGFASVQPDDPGFMSWSNDNRIFIINATGFSPVVTEVDLRGDG